jgi:hypothetical protein
VIITLVARVFDMSNVNPPLSFREKSAWLSLASFALGFGIYVWNAARVLLGYSAFHPGAELFLLAALIFASGALQLLIAQRSPEGRTPRDEREQLIALKATRPAFFVLLVCAFLSIATVHLPIPIWRRMKLLMLGVMLSITLAGIVNFALQVALYRRDR